MNIKQALFKRIPRIRNPNWANPNCYLRLPLMENGAVGPWAELYDEISQPIIGIPVGSQRILVVGRGFNVIDDYFDDCDYEVYTGPVSKFEQDNYARAYTES